MSDASPALDEAYDRLASSAFELPNGFVNHGPMACEALAALDCDDVIDGWARRVARSAGTTVDARAPVDFVWEDALGDRRRLPEWIGHFERAIADDGWPAVVEVWVPRLMPALAVALFHGAIRVAHAVRAVDAVDSSARRAELARALGYWAARYDTGQPVTEVVDVDDARRAIVDAAADGARYYLSQPNILNLHGVTGAMAVELMADHIPSSAGAAGLAQVHAEHAALYRGANPTERAEPAGASDDRLAQVAADSRDPHQVKLVEACRRGYAATGDPIFAAAAETVTGVGS